MNTNSTELFEQFIGRKRDVLESIAAGVHIHDALPKSGLSRQTVYDWRKADPNFRVAFTAAKSAGKIARIEKGKRLIAEIMAGLR